MSPIIKYQSIDVCSFNCASDWPTFDASSIQLTLLPLLQHTIVLLFMIGPSCLVKTSVNNFKSQLDKHTSYIMYVLSDNHNVFII